MEQLWDPFSHSVTTELWVFFLPSMFVLIQPLITCNWPGVAEFPNFIRDHIFETKTLAEDGKYRIKLYESLLHCCPRVKVKRIQSEHPWSWKWNTEHSVEISSNFFFVLVPLEFPYSMSSSLEHLWGLDQQELEGDGDWWLHPLPASEMVRAKCGHTVCPSLQ